MTEVEILLNFVLIDQFLDILLISLHNLYACQVKREKQDLGYVIYFCQTKIYNFNPICFILKFPKYYYKIALIFFFFIFLFCCTRVLLYKHSKDGRKFTVGNFKNENIKDGQVLQELLFSKEQVRNNEDEYPWR